MPLQLKGALAQSGSRVQSVGGVVARIDATPTVSTTPAYASGDNVGGKILLAGAARLPGGSGLIQSVVITSKSLQSATFDVVFFNADPTATAATDNAPQDIADADLAKVVGVAQCATVVPLTGASIHQATGLAMPFAGSSGSRDLYAIIVVRGTPTFASTSDVQLSVRILQD